MYYGNADLDVKQLLKLVPEELKNQAESLIDEIVYISHEGGVDEGEETMIFRSQELAGDWITDGEFDDEVENRAEVLGMRYLKHEGNDLLQQMHRLMHPHGPWGWEFCATCMK